MGAALIAPALLACHLGLSDATLFTLGKVIGVESHGNSLAIRVNGLPGPQPHASNAKEATAIAERFIAAGYKVDLGATQVDSANLPALSRTVAEMFDYCTNVRAGHAILAADYGRAAAVWGEGQQALRAALRAYNTGRFDRGWAYLARYDVPALTVPQTAITRVSAAHAAARPLSLRERARLADQVVFVREEADAGR